MTIAYTTKVFFTEKWHYTIIDTPGHRDLIKNMITGASQADVALIMVPADGNFSTATARGNHKAGKVQGQTRQHARIINLLGVKQISYWREQDGLRLRGLQEGPLRRHIQRDDERVDQSGL